MREIKFRAMELPSDHVLGLGYKPKMVYGTGFLKDPVNTWLICNDEKQAIAFGQKQRIINPETVGQFTGLDDKNGKEIYEGDVVRDGFNSVRTIKWFDSLGYDGGGAMHSGFYFDETYDGRGELNYHNHMTDCEILGNIHENPESLNAH